jgi:site-specific DNA recombinase
MAARRVALYARFSSDLQRDQSIEDQLELCRSHVRRMGWSIVAEHSDRAKSGASLIGREGMIQLLAHARERRFDIVLVESADRISRDLADLAAVRKALAHFDVEIHSIGGGALDVMQTGLRGVIGEIFLQDLRAKTRRGMAGVVREGRSAGGRSYGYRPVPGEPGRLTIVEDEASLIRRIFEDYAAGQTPREIAIALNREGAAPPRGALWNSSTINGNKARSNGILANDIYAGRRVWNRTRMVRDPDTGRRISRVNPREEWQWHDAPEARIVDQTLFERVQALREERSKGAAVPHKRSKRLLSGLLRCGVCGGPMSAAGAGHNNRYPRIMCTRAREAGTCSATRRIPIKPIERDVVATLRRQLADPDVLAGYVSEFREAHRAAADAATRDKTKIERRLAEISKAMGRLVDAIADGVMSPEEARSRLAELRAEKAQLDERLELAKQELSVVELHPEAVNAYRADLETLGDALAEAVEAHDQDVLASLRRLIDSVIVTAGEKYQPAIVEIRGRLAAITGSAFVPNGKAEPDDAYPVVAGGRVGRESIIVRGLFSTSVR